MHQSLDFGFLALVVLAISWGGAIAFLLFLAGRNIRDLRGYRLAFAASILAMLPCHPAVIVTFPVGLWTLLVLLRPGMKAAFDERSAGEQSPFGGPLPPGKELPPAPRDADSRRLFESKAVWCARGLRFSGWIDLVGWAALAFFCVVETHSVGPAPRGIAIFLSLWGLRLAAGAIVILGAHHLGKMRSRSLAWLGAIVAIVPASPGWLVGLPCGVWAIFLLKQTEVQAEFARRQSLATSSDNAWRTWLAAAVVLAGAGASFSFVVVSTTGPRRSAPAVATYSRALSNDISYGSAPAVHIPDLIEIDGVLQINPSLLHLRLTPEQEVIINAALREARVEYLGLEAEHTRRELNDAGYRVVTVSPFAAEAKNALEDRFWSTVDAAFHSDDQRREVRHWLDLKLVAPYQEGLHLEYRKVGAFYRWRSAGLTGLLADFREDPRLPNDLQRIVDADQATLVEPPSPESQAQPVSQAQPESQSQSKADSTN